MPNKSSAPREVTTAESEAFALVQCLDYLETVARKAGFSLAAHMINLAKGAAVDAVPEDQAAAAQGRAALRRRQPSTRRPARRNGKAALRGALS